MSAIFYASSLTLPLTACPGRSDLFFHFSEYFVLGLFTARMIIRNPDGKHSLRPFLLAFSIVVGYGLLDEIHQGFVPGRDPDGLDWLVDALAGGLGIGAYPVLFQGQEQGTGARDQGSGPAATP
jgi:VanZ family protein